MLAAAFYPPLTIPLSANGRNGEGWGQEQLAVNQPVMWILITFLGSVLIILSVLYDDNLPCRHTSFGSQEDICKDPYVTINRTTTQKDSIGLHRVENPSHTEPAVSLHLYSPPFDHCQTFDQRTGHKNTVKMTFWSKYGERSPVATVQSQENN